MVQPFLGHYRHQDFLLCDVPGHLDVPYVYKDPAMRAFGDWSEDDCLKLTSFEKPELQRIYNCFRGHGLFEDNIYLPTAPGHFYNFTGEEIFLFGMTKVRTGETTSDLCYDYFGGSPRRWTDRYKYFLYSLDQRYSRVLGLEGLQRWVPWFPYFANRIATRFNTERYLYDTETGVTNRVETATIPVDDCDIMSLIDG